MAIIEYQKAKFKLSYALRMPFLCLKVPYAIGFMEKGHDQKYTPMAIY